MKRFLSLLFLVISFTAESQPLRKGSHVILIRNINNARFLRINENSNISVLTTSGKIIFGKIRLIKADTIFFHDTLVRVSDINRLYYPLSHFRPERTLLDERRPAYVAGSHWQIICPPDTVYRSSWSYTGYIHHLSRKVRNELLAPLDPLVYKNFLKWNVAKLFHLELGLSYERLISKKFSWETELSGMVGIPSANISINYPVLNYNGVSVTTCPKFYFIPRTYLSVVLMYRYLWVKGMNSDWPDGITGSLFQDQYRNDLGLSVRIGFMRRYGKFVVDYYVGGGIKYIWLHQQVYGHYGEQSNWLIWYHADHSSDIYNKNLFGPVFNLGIKIGWAFGH